VEIKQRKERLKADDVLKYSNEKRHQATVARFYLKWRKEQKIPYRCDNPVCYFHTAPLIWNGRELSLILDHKQGIHRDNRPEMLQFLCPNCDSQLDTRGGKNKGLVHTYDTGFTRSERDCHKAEVTYFNKVSASVKVEAIQPQREQNSEEMV